MKREEKGLPINLIRWIVVFAVLFLASGCQKAVSPTQKQVQKVEAQGAAITKTQDPQVQRQQLGKLAAKARALNEKKNADKTLKAAYRKALAAGKKAVILSDQQQLAANRAGTAKQETEKDIAEKLPRLAALAKTVTADDGLVYSTAARVKLLKDITAQTRELRAMRVQLVLAVDDPQRYLDAYQEYVVEGRGKKSDLGGDWGDAQIVPGLLDAVGLSKDKFMRIFGGLHEYYGHAVDQHIITLEQARPALDKAIDKLYAGDYADHPIKITQMNFYLIKKGDFGGLIGEWRPIAMVGDHDGEAWDTSANLPGELSITKYHVSDGTETLRGDSQGTKMVNGSDTIDVTPDESVEGELSYSGNFLYGWWSIAFLAKGMKHVAMPPNFNTQKEHIVIRTSAPWLTTVYERQ